MGPNERQILVEVHSVEAEDEVALLFADINKAQPLSLVDMPGAIPETTRVHLHEATDIMAERYTPMFSDSLRCRAPNVNVDKLRDDIFQSGVIARHRLNSTNDLVEWLEQTNATIAAEVDSRWKDQLTPTSKFYRPMIAKGL